MVWNGALLSLRELYIYIYIYSPFDFILRWVIISSSIRFSYHNVGITTQLWKKIYSQ